MLHSITPLQNSMYYLSVLLNSCLSQFPRFLLDIAFCALTTLNLYLPDHLLWPSLFTSLHASLSVCSPLPCLKPCKLSEHTSRCKKSDMSDNLALVTPLHTVLSTFNSPATLTLLLLIWANNFLDISPYLSSVASHFSQSSWFSHHNQRKLTIIFALNDTLTPFLISSYYFLHGVQQICFKLFVALTPVMRHGHWSTVLPLFLIAIISTPLMLDWLLSAFRLDKVLHSNGTFQVTEKVNQYQ